MAGRLVVVSGTGTGIGKTHFAEALLRALAPGGRRVLGVKPIESGVTDPATSDAGRLDAASSFHVKHFGHALSEPVSPHLAARNAGIGLVLDPLAAAIADLRPLVDVLLVELPGGLFTPLTERVLNADLAARLAPDLLLLVAPDRLGVLHDTMAACRAAAAIPLRIDGLVLVAPAEPDPSTSTNAAELALFALPPVWATLPRGPAPALALTQAMALIAGRILPTRR
ncbi:MAG TPA: dethiobiotin synthase [Polyangiaceae bacterium]|jgi:dethiobiotin synthetase